MLSDLLVTIKTETLIALDARHRPVPDRARVYWGQRPPVWPCPDAGELVVYCPRGFDTRSQWGKAEWEQGGPGRRCEEVFVRVVRCYPQISADGSPASDASVEAAAVGLFADLDAIWYGLMAKSCTVGGFAHAANEGVAVVDWKPLPPAGGRAAVEVRLIVQALP